MRVLYLQPGGGVGGSKVSLQGILSCVPAGQTSQVALTPPRDPGYDRAVSGLVEKIHYVKLPTWNAYRRKSWLEKTRAPFSHARRLLSLVPAALRLVRIIRSEGVDLVHTNNAISPAGAIAALIARVPHVWHVREPIGASAQYPLIVGDRLGASVFRRLSQAILCNSEYTSTFFRQGGMTVHVIHNGLDASLFATSTAAGRGHELRRRLLGGQGTQLVAMVGNLTTEWKRHDLFLVCAAELTARFPDCRYVIFGGSRDLKLTAYTRELRAQIERLHLDGRLVLAGFVDDIPAMMHSLDVLVHPAATEGSGRAVMEAMAAGKPVISVASGGVQELIEDGTTGFLVQPGDVLAMAARAGFLLENPKERASIGTRAQDCARRKFSSEAMMSSIQTIYRELTRVPTADATSHVG